MPCIPILVIAIISYDSPKKPLNILSNNPKMTSPWNYTKKTN